MGRPYSDKLVLSVKEHANNGTLTSGTRLAQLCIEANLPAAYVAAMLNMSRMTVYSWFRGKIKIRARNESEVKILIDRIEKDLDSGLLPAKNMAEAQSYANYRPVKKNLEVETPQIELPLEDVAA